jgi:hypothetical protein
MTIVGSSFSKVSASSLSSCKWRIAQLHFKNDEAHRGSIGTVVTR